MQRMNIHVAYRCLTCSSAIVRCASGLRCRDRLPSPTQSLAESCRRSLPIFLTSRRPIVSHAVSLVKITVATFLAFPETWKSRGIRQRSGKSPRVAERSRKLCKQGNLIVAAQQNNLPVLYSYCNSFFNKTIYLYFIRTVIHFSYMMFARLWISNCAFVQHFVCENFSVWRVEW